MLMEIPVLNRIISFDKSYMNNPSSFISRVFHFMGTQEISIQIYNLWAWGALIFAVIATFTGGINRAKLLIFRLWKGNSVISIPLLQSFENDDDDEDEDDDSCSSVSSSDDEEEDEYEDEDEEVENHQDEHDFRVAGFGNYSEDKGQMTKKKLYRRRSSKNRFSWADFTNGKSVVKLWEGLGLGFESYSGSVISLFDLNRNQITNSFLCGGSSSCQIPAVSAISPAVIMSGGYDNGDRKKAALRVWDSRTGSQTPEAIAEWIPHRRSNQMGIDSDGSGIVYVTDDVSSTIRDLRKIGSAFEIVTEFDGTKDTFWEW